jgi:DNA-binding transcriptional ArsR family regulator
MVTKTPDAILEVLGDGTRRAIVGRLRAGPRSVHEITEGMPVSRPAVSKHLRLMKDAGLVTDTAVGTERFYELNVDALARLHRWVEEFWDTALERFRDAAEGRPPGKGKR